ncbi:cation transport protein-domain-containing protein [Cantharellus anzutake]|uniref:cation transport protein-domain-containing protein n=1 Tax=Cantharellus anzutake TaxID=1750568 RepID=UPI0019075D4D|nr:cation transport protein-domain-containing protein [Cantharellus anzutake]KAF8342643.1 cation transport protein-domain-containing protein [Cantharellus anzutake]
MPLPPFLHESSFLAQAWLYSRSSLNFYRVHIIVFTVTPLIFSAIMYGSNGRYPVSYIDCLYNCVSAMTVTGLATINLSGLTAWQQFILWFQMSVGNIVTVSWVMVLVRQQFLKAQFESAVQYRNRNGDTRGGRSEILRIDMIRRVGDLTPVNPMGFISGEGTAIIDATGGRTVLNQGPVTGDVNHSGGGLNPSSQSLTSVASSRILQRRASDRGETSGDGDAVETALFDSERRIAQPNSQRSNATEQDSSVDPTQFQSNFPRTQTIEFVQPEQLLHRRERGHSLGLSSTAEDHIGAEPERWDRGGPLGLPGRTNTIRTIGSEVDPPPAGSALPRRTSAKDLGFGGFPMPHQLLARIGARLFPTVAERIERTTTNQAQAISLQPSRVSASAAARTGLGMTTARTKSVPYISFDAVVGRNSRFHGLTKEELEELGGVEYRALKLLLWLVPAYHFGWQLIIFTILAPYMAQSRWKPVFQSQIRPLGSTWYTAFIVTSAYTNSGTSLVDQSMTPFQNAYPQIIFLFIIIFAGNTAYPVFLRLTIWIMAKCVAAQSRIHETLHFLLDHPRRCFVYLFPSHQTWFLFAFVAVLTVTDWVSFLVLDVGNPEIMRLPVGQRLLIGLLQSGAVRAAGFSVVALSVLAPAVQVIYVIMMYISVYPIAIAVRSTNVYEERSLGIIEEDHLEEPSDVGSRGQVLGRYFAWHARRQLAFDMWWIAVALVLVCIVERGQIEDNTKVSIDIFPIIFELVSAYGTVGMSLGANGQNYSLSGVLSPLSKVIICLVMLRGRHRGLPVAIDRAVMLPKEYQREDAEISALRSRSHYAEGNHPVDTDHHQTSQPNVSGRHNTDRLTKDR